MNPTLTPELIAGLSLFALVSSLTPGPNNMMLLASGANFGFRRTLPHLMGVSVGFIVLLAIVGLGLGAVFAAYPPLHTVLQVMGGLYLVWLAWKIGTAKGIGGGGDGSGRPMSFLQAAAFQWVNPKAWAMALGAATTYAPQQHYVANILVVSLLFGAINLPCCGSWATLGTVMRRFLTRPGVLRMFNLVMAALLLASLYPVVGELAHAFAAAPRSGAQVHPGNDLRRGAVGLAQGFVSPAVESAAEGAGGSARLQILMETPHPE